MATTGLLITLFNLLAISTLLITVPSSTAAPVQRSVVEDYFEDNVIDALRVAHYAGLSDQQEYPLTSSNPEIDDFLREVCDVVAYSELALKLSNQTDEELQGVLTTAAVSKYQALLSTVVQKTCSWAKSMAADDTSEMAANPAFQDNSCSPDSITYLHRHCFSMRLMSLYSTVTKEAYNAARNYNPSV